MEIKNIIELMKAVSENGLTCFELEQGDTRITMKREKKTVLQTEMAVQEIPVSLTSEEASPAEKNVSEKAAAMENVHSDRIVMSPLVGTFYSSPAPDADDYVKVGDHVKKGQVIGIVEAMKLMNEIESEYDGIVEEILVKNEETVEYGQPLFRIR